MEIQTFKASNLPDAWFQLIYALVKGGAPHNIYEIDKGSYVGQQRLEFPYVTVQIDRPGDRPLIPEIPPGLAIPPPVESMEYVRDYFAQYLMNPELEENETYKYATWLAPGVERVIDQLKDSPGNNQAAISIGGWAPGKKELFMRLPEHGSMFHQGSIDKMTEEEIHHAVDTDNFTDPATNQRDPACLRVVDFRLDQDNALHMVVYFRSWDLWGGFPANLAGLQLLKEYVGLELEAKDGRIIAASKGLHLYSHAIQVAATRVGMSEISTLDDLSQWMENNYVGL